MQNIQDKDKQIITEFLENKDKDLEFEVRFGELLDNKFKPFITEQQYFVIKDYLEVINEKKFQDENEEYSLTVCHKNGERVTQFLEKPKNKECDFSFPWKGDKIINEKIIYKKNIKKIDYSDLKVRFSIAEEKDVKDASLLYKKENPSVFFKIRKRLSCRLKNIQFDLSMMKCHNDINLLESQDISYDFEIEIIPEVPDKYDYENFAFILEQFLKITLNIYEGCDKPILNKKETLLVLDNYQKLTGKNHFIGCKPETLKQSKYNKNQEYALTLKLDGERKFVYIYNDAVYLINNKMEIEKYKNDKSYTINCINNTLIDCEIFNGQIYCFDILFFNSKDVRNLEFKNRMPILGNVMTYIFDKNFLFKAYIYEDIYSNMMKMIEIDNVTKEICLKDKNIDGFILVDINKGYPINKTHCKNGEIPLKWKPENLNTIDFTIKKKDNGDYDEWELLCSEKNNTLVKFNYKGDNSLSNVKVKKEISKLYKDNTVVECKYDKNKKCFFPFRSRKDKERGNYIDVAKDIFNNINEPFNLENLKKNRKESEFFNMRRFHNWIKRKLLTQYSNKSKNLLDLACGKGGDIQKWVDNNIRYVEGYDINNDSIGEAIKRFEKISSRPIYKNFNYHFQEKDLSKEIIKTDNIFELSSCFFAIHYFYETKKTLENFIENLKCLKNEGYFIMTTLCSKKLKDINYTYESENLTIKNVKHEKSINVYIKDSVLNKETLEYIVDYDFTINFMKSKGFELVETKTFDEYYPEWVENENFLSIGEMQYSFMNRVYVFVKKPLKCDMSIKELKKYCKDNNLVVSGNKDDLIKRMNDHLKQ